MQTDISELEGIFDFKPMKVYGDKLKINLDEGNLFVWFSLGNCVSSSWGAWDIEEGKVISFTFYPKKGYKPSYYSLDNIGAKQEVRGKYSTFKNEETGLYYETQHGKVMRINYTPSRKYNNLRCPKQSF